MMVDAARRLARLPSGARAHLRAAATLAPLVPLPTASARAPRTARAASMAALAAGSMPRAPRVTLGALLTEKDARIAFIERELVERLADKDALIAHKDARIASFER